MNLFLVRHGEAVSELVDPSRPLSEEGMHDVAEIAAFMMAAGVSVDEIWYSTKLRAKQTAELLAEAVPYNNIIERQGIAPNDAVEMIASEIEALQENVMLVGHLPFLECLASYLLTGSTDKQVIDFEQGGVVCLKKIDAGWSITWMMLPEFISHCVEEV